MGEEASGNRTLVPSSNDVSEQLVTMSPVTNKPILTRQSISPSELSLLPGKSEQAFDVFRATSIADRQKIVAKALDLLEESKDALAKELTEQMGRPIAYTAKEVTTAVMRGRYLLKISGEALKDTEGEEELGFKRYIRKVPHGPVLVLFAWNVGCDRILSN